MGFVEPKKITKQHVLDAAMRIEIEKVVYSCK